MAMLTQEFMERLTAAAGNALIKNVSEGGWIMPDYGNRIKVPAELMREVWGMIDFKRFKQAIAERIERELADRIVNHIAAELATDVKTILGDKYQREALRSMARQHIENMTKRPPQPTDPA